MSVLDIDYVPFEHLSLERIRDTYTYGQLKKLDTRVARLSKEGLVQYLQERLNTLPWKHLAHVFIQNTDVYMRTSCAHRSWVDLVSYEGDEEEIFFYSKSKEDPYRPFPHIPTNWKRVLSNFYPSRIIVRGNGFPTAEHAFHGMKILLASSGPTEAALHALLECDSAADAKKFGGRASFKAWKIQLDLPKWAQLRVQIQREITMARVRSDPLFVSVLRWTSARHLRHFERGSAKCPPFWGQLRTVTGEYIGQNVLGRLLMEARDTLGTNPSHA